MKKTKSDSVEAAQDRDLYSGLMRLHILHHAVEGPVFGLGMAEELARHGYRISPGTLYPLLHEERLSARDRAAQRQIPAQGLPRHASRTESVAGGQGQSA